MARLLGDTGFDCAGGVHSSAWQCGRPPSDSLVGLTRRTLIAFVDHLIIAINNETEWMQGVLSPGRQVPLRCQLASSEEHNVMMHYWLPRICLSTQVASIFLPHLGNSLDQLAATTKAPQREPTLVYVGPGGGPPGPPYPTGSSHQRIDRIDAYRVASARSAVRALSGEPFTNILKSSRVRTATRIHECRRISVHIFGPLTSKFSELVASATHPTQPSLMGSTILATS
jgi:hypothetical protein